MIGKFKGDYVDFFLRERIKINGNMLFLINRITSLAMNTLTLLHTQRGSHKEKHKEIDTERQIGEYKFNILKLPIQ